MPASPWILAPQLGDHPYVLAVVDHRLVRLLACRAQANAGFEIFRRQQGHPRAVARSRAVGGHTTRRVTAHPPRFSEFSGFW
jgi:hypothetical protein